MYPTQNIEIHTINYYDNYEDIQFNDTRFIKQEGDIVYDEQISLTSGGESKLTNVWFLYPPYRSAFPYGSVP